MTKTSTTTLTDWISERARQRPDETALIDDGRHVGWRDLDERSRALAAGLARTGIGVGDRVAVWLPNSAAWLEWFFACTRIGAIVMAVNTRYRAHEVADIVRRSGSRMLVYQPGFKGIDFDAILRDVDPRALSGLQYLVAVGAAGVPSDGLPREARRLHADELFASAPCAAAPTDASRGCLLFTTSGTTKAPKFVLQNLDVLSRHAVDVAGVLGLVEGAPGEPIPRPWEGRSTTVLNVPMCGTFGFTQAMAFLRAGALLVLRPVADPAGDLAAIAHYRATHLIASDMTFARLVALRPNPEQIRSLRFCAFGTFTPGLHDIVSEVAKSGLTLRALYGSSEMHALFSFQDGPWPAQWPLPAGGGRPVTPAVKVRARDPLRGAVLVDGEVGELEILSPYRFVEYFGDPAATAAAFDDEGYFRTGDSGYTMPDGQFAYLERAGDVMRLAGFLVSPAEIEAVLLEDDGLLGCQVVSATAPDGRPVPVAFVIVRSAEPFDEAAAIARCRHALAAFKVPARVVVVDAFPMTDSANATKVQKVALRKRAEELLAGPPPVR